ncbi:hypothetical protein VP01_973g2 [Puccinia sorghi]|uniref:DUF4219 domain-containing protein n=1 Tax=Puccinia sorghi TaxID=27349 RepID=A0A0L6U5V6_9BASI|nr:hypothetical protein VP01_973g2 [Puccinia sorghi]
MDEINATILKTTIEAIPVLTKENYSSWRTRSLALFKLGGVKDQMLNGEPALEESNNTILCAICETPVTQRMSNLRREKTPTKQAKREE